MVVSLLVVSVAFSAPIFSSRKKTKQSTAAPIKIGAILAVTGPASFLGAPESKTAEMFVDKLNQAGGLNGQKIELLIRDSGGSPEKAISLARQLIYDTMKKVGIKKIGVITSNTGFGMAAISLAQVVPLPVAILGAALITTVLGGLVEIVFIRPVKNATVLRLIIRTITWGRKPSARPMGSRMCPPSICSAISKSTAERRSASRITTSRGPSCWSR